MKQSFCLFVLLLETPETTSGAKRFHDLGFMHSRISRILILLRILKIFIRVTAGAGDIIPVQNLLDDTIMYISNNVMFFEKFPCEDYA